MIQAVGDREEMQSCIELAEDLIIPSIEANGDDASHLRSGCEDYRVGDGEFSGVLEFRAYDHFGLDTEDELTEYGFVDWFTLQHYDRFDGRYSPPIAVVTIRVPFRGYPPRLPPDVRTRRPRPGQLRRRPGVPNPPGAGRRLDAVRAHRGPRPRRGTMVVTGSARPGPVGGDR